MSVNINRALKLAAFSMGCLLSLSVILFFTAFPSHAAGSDWVDNMEDDSSVMTNNWANHNICTPNTNVVLSSDEAVSGDWSLSWQRNATIGSCTSQKNTALSSVSGDIITGDFWLRSNDTDAQASVNFLDSSGDLVMTMGFDTGSIEVCSSTIESYDADTWYHIGWYYDTQAEVGSARVINGSNVYEMPGGVEPCSGATTDGNVSELRLVASGGTGAQAILYLDNMSVNAADESFELPDNFTDLFGEESNVGSILADYPSHDDVYGACSIWGGIFSGSTDDGAACIWTWIQYALVPEDFSVVGLLASPVRMLESRWPFTYITVPLNAIGVGLDNGDCPFTEQLFTDDFDLNGSTVTIPDFDICDIFETPDLAAGFAAHTTAQSAVVALIYVSLGVLMWKKADDFMRG